MKRYYPGKEQKSAEHPGPSEENLQETCRIAEKDSKNRF